MAYLLVEIACSPVGTEKYPVPTTIRIARIYASADEAASEFPTDQIVPPPSEYRGQSLYYVLWKSDDPLNLDREATEGENIVSNCGMWLEMSKRPTGDVTDLSVELVPPERVKARAKQRALAQRAAGQEPRKSGEGGGGTIQRSRPDSGYRGRAPTTWNKAF